MGDLDKFTGFNSEAFTFLHDIAANNNREWFEANKPIYRNQIEAPAKSLLQSLKSALIVMTDREMDGKIFRFYRDVRFSKNKSPYKNNIRMLIYPEGRTQNNSGDIPIFYVSVEADKIHIGVGTMVFDKITLDKFRRAMVDDEQSQQFLNLVNPLLAKGFTVNEPPLKRVPSGFDKTHKNAEWLKRKGMAVWFDTDIKKLQGKDSISNLMNIFSQCQGLYDWLKQL
ncbi:MAG: DUF2461 domain-containing protein [Alphaproteobacteria bacterium]|nr:DUF2461 domain-containing protein [Alphaproteobacteria bacterium]